MNQEEVLNQIDVLFDDIYELLKIKGKDYADPDRPFANFESGKDIGISTEQMIILRISEKLERVKRVMVRGNEVDETLEDTLKDIIGLSALLYVLKQ